MRWFAVLALVVAACAVPASGPATLADFASTTTGTEVSIPVLVNDWPAGELTLEGATVTHPGQGVNVRADGEQLVISSEQFEGTAQIEYTVSLGAMQATGLVEVEILQPTLDIAFDETDFGTVPLFTETQLVGTLTGSLGATPVSVDVEGPVRVDTCEFVDEGSSCDVIVTWAPDHVDGPLAALVSINGAGVEFSGQPVHGLEATIAQPWSVAEGSVFAGEVTLRNVTTHPLRVASESTGGLVAEGCDFVGPAEICTVGVSFDATTRPASAGPITGTLVFRYGLDAPTIETELEYLVAVESVEPSTPVLEPIPEVLWLGDIAGLPLSWSSETPPPGGYRVTTTCDPDEVNCDNEAFLDQPTATQSPHLDEASESYLEIALETFELAEIGGVTWSVDWLTADAGASETATERVAVVSRPAEYGSPTFEGATDGGSSNDFVVAHAGEKLTVTLGYQLYTLSQRRPTVLAEVSYVGDSNTLFATVTDLGVSSLAVGDQLIVNVDLMPFFDQIGGQKPIVITLDTLIFVSDKAAWCQPSLCEHQVSIDVDFWTIFFDIQ